MAVHYGYKPLEVPYLDPLEFAFNLLCLRAKSDFVAAIAGEIKTNQGMLFLTKDIGSLG